MTEDIDAQPIHIPGSEGDPQRARQGIDAACAGQPGGGDGYGNPTHDDFDGGSGGSGYGITTGNGGGGGAASYVKSSGGYILALAGGGGGGGGGGTSGSTVGDGSDGGWQA